MLAVKHTSNKTSSTCLHGVSSGMKVSELWQHHTQHTELMFTGQLLSLTGRKKQMHVFPHLG